ncbi:MAG TPA: ribonuclease HII [Patescibacteria group bacterium]|nr:ribonuclease HII [Patescibacteria group bacterium]
MKKRSTLRLEKEYWKTGYEFVIGVDEVGRGPLAGPVVACATVWRKFQISNDPVKSLCDNGASKTQINPNFKILNSKQFRMIKDSKMLSAKQREEIYDFLCEHFYFGIGICDHKTIDRINIAQASYLAMKKALIQLKKEIYNNHKINIIDRKHIVLIDGKHRIPRFSLEQKPIVDGDAQIKIISAASIIAKLERDKIMVEMHKAFPAYGFNLHKGYGTKMHLNMIRKYGLCDIHRRSYGPCKKSQFVDFND